MFNKRGINSEGMILQENRWTPRFVRVIAGGAKYPAQHGDRFDFENSNPIEDSTAKRIIDYIDRMKGNIDAIIAADYNEFGKGIINKSLLDKVKEIAKARKIILIGDSRQGFENFYGFTCIKPNISEARQLCSVGAHSIDDLAWRIENRLNLSSILISMDKDGMYLLTKSGIKKELPSYAKKVVDVTGAGDSVISAFTLALVSGFGYEDSAQLAGYAAAISVSKPGVDVVFLNELKQFAENEK